jgi:hypothetical protein
VEAWSAIIYRGTGGEKQQGDEAFAAVLERFDPSQRGKLLFWVADDAGLMLEPDHPKLKQFQSDFRRQFPKLWTMFQDAERKGLLKT